MTDYKANKFKTISALNPINNDNMKDLMDALDAINNKYGAAKEATSENIDGTGEMNDSNSVINQTAKEDFLKRYPAQADEEAEVYPVEDYRSLINKKYMDIDNSNIKNPTKEKLKALEEVLDKMSRGE